MFKFSWPKGGGAVYLNYRLYVEYRFFTLRGYLLVQLYFNFFFNFRAILCAYTLECIDPPGSTIVCEHPYVGIAKCHRQDQSIINILTNNLEKEILLEGFYIFI